MVDGGRLGILMKTRVSFVVKYSTSQMESRTKGFWFWKRTVEEPQEYINKVFYNKEQAVPISSDHVRLPNFGSVKIRSRTAETDHESVWLGGLGYWIGSDFEFEYLNEDEFKEIDKELIAAGFQRS